MKNHIAVKSPILLSEMDADFLKSVYFKIFAKEMGLEAVINNRKKMLQIWRGKGVNFLIQKKLSPDLNKA
ncbi:MAG: hypothetical protein JXR70_19700 [Spirochaetales bacterium]|nr:hypothetical protein [Spirochaetales bacterium]